MTQLKTILLVAAAVGGLSASAAAGPMKVGRVQEPSLVQNARMICNDRGRYFETRGRVYRDYDEDYVTPRRSYEYRGPYRDYDEGAGWNCALASAIAGDNSRELTSSRTRPSGRVLFAAASAQRASHATQESLC
jgi:hypothetical protein